MNAGTFDHLIGRCRDASATLPDRRTGDNSRYAMADIALSAFSVFFTQCPSFLSFQQNISQQAIGYMENGLRYPSLETVLRIAKAMDVDLSKIIKRAHRELSK